MNASSSESSQLGSAVIELGSRVDCQRPFHLPRGNVCIADTSRRCRTSLHAWADSGGLVLTSEVAHAVQIAIAAVTMNAKPER